MAVLRNPRTGTRVLLRTLHLFGRHPSCRTVLPYPDVSSMHAVVRWNVAQWEILDRSRNGTLVDGQRLPAGEWRSLDGARAVSMGADEGAQWLVEDLAPPLNCIFSPEGNEAPIALEPDGTFLPNAACTQLLVYCQAGEWIVESADGAAAILDGARITLDGRQWEFASCPSIVQTSEPVRRPPPSPLVLHFSLSQNEEHAILHVESRAGALELGERVHHYTLATLARLRLDDARRGIQPPEQGWVRSDDLKRMLGVDLDYVNIQLFRARQQLAQALPPGAEARALVERRRGELRLGDIAFTVRRGAMLEGGLARAPSGELVPM